jgi:molybdopterin converting factor small subunit
MAQVILPSSLQERTGGSCRFTIDATTAGEALRQLEQQQPAIVGWVLDEQKRLREHIKIFVNADQAELTTPLRGDDELHVVRAISGGSDADAPAAGDGELLVGTHKGLIVLRGPRGGPMEIVGREFAGQPVEFAVKDPRSDRYFASVTHGQHGPHLFFATDPLGDWRQASGPAFPEGADAAVERIWIVQPGVDEGVLWAGVAPAALFRSEDDGESWKLNEGLWNHPSRPRWEGGMGGLCLHSICPWPGEPKKLAVAISAVGVWVTDDGGNTWRSGNEGLVPRYLPEEARDTTLTHCVHNMHRAPRRPQTLFMQFHGGVYRSDDGGDSWTDIATDTELPADFGFPLALDAADPDSAFVIPMVSDRDRVTVDGKVRVYTSRDGGASWRALGNGLPQSNAYLTVLRQAFCADGHDPLGLYFGAESGDLFGSADGGASWVTLADHLPPILSVRAAH